MRFIEKTLIEADPQGILAQLTRHAGKSIDNPRMARKL